MLRFNTPLYSYAHYGGILIIISIFKKMCINLF